MKKQNDKRNETQNVFDLYIPRPEDAAESAAADARFKAKRDAEIAAEAAAREANPNYDQEKRARILADAAEASACIAAREAKRIAKRNAKKSHREWQDRVIAECKEKAKDDTEFSSLLFDAAQGKSAHPDAGTRYDLLEIIAEIQAETGKAV